ncbi:MAG TPA: hypothetical protein VIL64_00670 [Solirubrobacteraceae bacterium]|jgi:uncharacterized membrane protein YccC
MAKAKAKAAKASSAAAAASPYVKRVVQDGELRDNLRTAFDSARVAYGRLSNGKPAAKVVLDDKKFQKELRTASQSLRDAADALREGPKGRQRKQRSGGLGRKLLLLVVGAGIALAVSEGLRNKVLDALFGAEEEFDYQSTTTPSTPPASPVGAA